MSLGWLASIADGDSIINATSLILLVPCPLCINTTDDLHYMQVCMENCYCDFDSDHEAIVQCLIDLVHTTHCDFDNLKVVKHYNKP